MKRCEWEHKGSQSAVFPLTSAATEHGSALTNNNALIQSQIIKCCKITAWNWFLLPSFTHFSLFVAQVFNQFFSFRGFFHALLKKYKSRGFCIHPSCPYMRAFWRILFFSSSATATLKRLDGLLLQEEEGFKKKVLQALESTWFWCNNHTLTFSCACAHPSSYVLSLKSCSDERE